MFADLLAIAYAVEATRCKTANDASNRAGAATPDLLRMNTRTGPVKMGTNGVMGSSRCGKH